MAQDAVSGRFRYAGVTLDLGQPPDWQHGGLADDEEWHIEWSKFYFGLDLAHAFSVTDDRSYLDAWQGLVASWIDQREPDCDPPEVTARRVQNWLYAWQGFDRVPGFTGLDPQLEDRLLTSLAAQIDHVATNLTPERNHRTLELFALLVVSLGLPVLDPGGVRASRAWADLQDNLLTDVWSDGVHRERSSHYHLIALRSFVAARVNITRFGGQVPPAYDERLRAALRFGMHLHRPDGYVPALSDSDSDSYLDLLGLAADSLDAADLRYVATRGREGTPPSERCADFPVGGYYVQRSGWGAQEPLPDERFLVFGCGPLGDGGHGHYDALAVEAYGHGHPLVVDPGRYTYAEGSPELAPLVQGHRRAQHPERRRPRPAALPAWQAQGSVDEQPAARPAVRRRRGPAARRGHQSGVRRRAPADRALRGRRVLAGLRHGALRPNRTTTRSAGILPTTRRPTSHRRARDRHASRLRPCSSTSSVPRW